MKQSYWVAITMAAVIVTTAISKEKEDQDMIRIVIAILGATFFICQAIETKKK